MPRIPYADLDTLPAAMRERVGKYGVLNVTRMLAHTGARTLEPWTDVIYSLLTSDDPPPRLREIAILRVGYRLDWPQASMAYVSDTTADPNAAYVDAIRGVDWLIHECYFGDGMDAWAAKTGHSWTTAVAQVAQKASVKRLILVHLNPFTDDVDPVGLEVARKIFPATELAHDNMVVPLWGE